MHYFAMLLVLRIAQMLVSRASSGQRSLPFVAAVLYTVSPAGIFLSAPYTESLFAFCNLFGTYLYMLSFFARRSDKVITCGILLLASGIVFGIATVVRSNGILSGALFACDALEVLSNMYMNGVHRRSLLMLAFLIISGSTIAVGTIGPQLLAYREYCSNVAVQHQRGWCQRTIPSIFAFVQSHYW